jgi:hypothetical protein
MKPKMMNVDKSRTFFRTPHVVWWILIPFGMLLTTVGEGLYLICINVLQLSWLAPSSVLLLPVGPLGRLAHYLGTQHAQVMMLVYKPLI